MIREGGNNDELYNYSERENYIRSKKIDYDWSAQICEGATVEDLDLESIQIAKLGYIEKQVRTEEDKRRIQNYSDGVFLDEASITTDGKITNTAILLLGKEKSQHYLKPMGGAEIFWREMTSLDDISFKIPFVKTIQNVVAKITTRNIELSLKIVGQPMMNKIKENYSKETLRECVANCVAHQDYTKSARVLIYEYRNERIRFENAGSSLYSKDEFNKIRLKEKIPNKYRNEFLRNAMEQIGLIEAKGTGHYKIYRYNTTEVYLPLPEVDWSNKEEFVLTLYGASLDKKFAEILQEKTDLEPEAILLLDQVQKGFKIEQKVFYNLKKQGLVEGTPTKGRLSFEFMKQIGKENEYIDQSEDEHLKVLIYKKIKHTKNCTRNDITEYIYPKFSENLSEQKKYIKLMNLLAILKKEGWIDSIGGRKYAIWITKKPMKLEQSF